MSKKIYSLIPGRFQCIPPHKGHIALIRTELDKGKNVCIALRNTDISEKNPYTIRQRKKAFKKAFKQEWKRGRIKIIEIPDIDTLVYGRGVGYEVKQVHLSPELESISGTSIREKLRKTNDNFHNRRIGSGKNNSR